MEVNDELYESILSRSHAFDGIAFIGIRTTGIVCFPSCRSRIPKRENIDVFTTVDNALKKGYRVCKRCRPDLLHAPDVELAERVQELLTLHFPSVLTLDAVGQYLHVSPRHISRTLRRTKNMTLKDCTQRLWIKKAMELLRDPKLGVREIARELGSSASYFSRRFHQATGMTPTAFRLQSMSKGEQ